MVNDTQTVAFAAKPRLYEPKAEIGSGLMVVQMRLATGNLFKLINKNLLILWVAYSNMYLVPRQLIQAILWC